MSGHVFVVRGDLQRLACDAVVLPCDDEFNIDPVWREFLPVGLPPVSGSSWLRLTGPAGDTMGWDLEPSKGRRVRAVVTTVNSMVGSRAAPNDVAARLAAGVQHISAGLEPQGGRHLPLIAVPLAGTGSGGLAHRRGEVIAALLSRYDGPPMESTSRSSSGTGATLPRFRMYVSVTPTGRS